MGQGENSQLFLESLPTYVPSGHCFASAGQKTLLSVGFWLLVTSSKITPLLVRHCLGLLSKTGKPAIAQSLKLDTTTTFLFELFKFIPSNITSRQMINENPKMFILFSIFVLK